MSYEYFEAWARPVEDGTVRSNQWIKLAIKKIRKDLDSPGVTVNTDQVDRCIELGERYFFKLFPWQKAVIELIHAIKDNGRLLYRRIDLVMGRGSGKNGFISFLIWYFSTPYYGIRGYDVDLVANSEEQAIRSFEDVYNILEDNAEKMGKQFEWSKTRIKNTRTQSVIKFNTASAKTKDSKRTGVLIFDEWHQYENYDMIKVFRSGLGKRPHPREIWISSNGIVRDAVFDQETEAAKDILLGKRPGNGRLSLLWMLEDFEDAKDEANWEISVPSLPYLPDLLDQMRDHWTDAQLKAEDYAEFMTKRMGLPLTDPDIEVTTWDNIVRASREIPIDLTGRECVLGVDYAKTTDFVAAVLWFRQDDVRYLIKKTWVCKSSKDWPRIKAPLDQWARDGHIEIVDAPEISPRVVGDWVREMQTKYQIVAAAIDSYRYTLLSEELERCGFVAKDNLILTTGRDVVKTAPIITSLFATGSIAFGDDPEMRWSINNAKQVSVGRDRDLGNYTFGKQEPKSRKTDSFMAMVSAATQDDRLVSAPAPLIELGTFSW